MSKDILSPGEAIALGELLSAIQQGKPVRWLAQDDDYTIHEGELRSLVAGPNHYAFAPFGTDVREMHVWVTGRIGETTFSVRHGMQLLQDGGMAFERRDGSAQ